MEFLHLHRLLRRLGQSMCQVTLSPGPQPGALRPRYRACTQELRDSPRRTGTLAPRRAWSAGCARTTGSPGGPTSRCGCAVRFRRSHDSGRNARRISGHPIAARAQTRAAGKVVTTATHVGSMPDSGWFFFERNLLHFRLHFPGRLRLPLQIRFRAANRLLARV